MEDVPHELKKLDEEFQSVWLSGEGLSERLIAWQENVQTTLDSIQPNDEYIKHFERLMIDWQTVLKENRDLIIDVQDTIRSDLIEGQRSAVKEANAKKFK